MIHEGLSELTKVYTPEGYSDINEVLPGTIINVGNKSGAIVACEVGCAVCESLDNLLLVIFRDNTSLVCTRGLQFLMVDGSVKRADQLIYEDSLKTSDGSVVQVKSVSFYYKSMNIYSFMLKYNTDPRFVEVHNHIYACIGQ